MTLVAPIHALVTREIIPRKIFKHKFLTQTLEKDFTHVNKLPLKWNIKKCFALSIDRALTNP